MTIRSAFFQHSLLCKYTWSSPNDTETQIDRVLIDGRHFSDLIDVRTHRCAGINSDHYLVVAKLRQRLCEVNKIRRGMSGDLGREDSGCSTTPVGTRSRTHCCEDSKPISSGIRSAAWKSWSSRTWNSCIARKKRASSTKSSVNPGTASCRGPKCAGIRTGES